MEKLIPCRFHIEVGSVLKAEGMRTTKQRLDIWDELCSTDDHRDIETILQSLIKKKINVSRATLYRTIDVFVKHDLLKKVSLGNGKILYEHNKKSISPRHDHILCEDCGEIFEFFDSNITILENEIAKKLNMKVTQRTHQLSGVCNSKNCSHLTN
ncbi:MAG: transcriptional repressor [Candidatus Neomarinimicrobiota bacterium]|nr:transcriptional repressor [Candidatus Neomarinimicrobiota bacterium]